MELEIWRNITGFDNYQVSNLGSIKNVKSGKLLKGSDNGDGYLIVSVKNIDKYKTMSIHVLVAMAFHNHIPCGYNLVVDHIDKNRKNNNKSNLRVITTRLNTSNKKLNKTSNYIGVFWHKKANKWMSMIRLGKNHKYLGLFENEIDAHNAYKDKLKDISSY